MSKPGADFKMRRRGMAWWLGAAVGTSIVIATAGWLARQNAAAMDVKDDTRQPVLVELFTSEGCSSCPPADRLLADLDRTQPIAGARVIVLSEHVTYWDHEGWRDSYSLDQVTDRQKWYDNNLGMSQVYTPQAIVDGAVQVLGSDEGKLTKAISDAAARSKEELSIDNAAWTGDAVSFTIHHGDLTNGKIKQGLVAVLAEDETETPVKSGENAGKTLKNVAVVRVLREINAATAGPLTLKLPGEDKAVKGPLRIVVFAVDKHTGHVLGAAEQTVTRS
jgi:hypothetical protein